VRVIFGLEKIPEEIVNGSFSSVDSTGLSAGKDDWVTSLIELVVTEESENPSQLLEMLFTEMVGVERTDESAIEIGIMQ
jgi:hypothetical protein